ncbi:hypothetical protein FQN60_009322 [Etheostoma spectabile]|uniref:Uncharacterized protein n=1 Tax=Etheostoma spectabile TaxID=54343 RepID=A0A5J5DIK5_9PERO|nr:hypothetical protein FQN60_009322 [Etheostoma spectabile]
MSKLNTGRKQFREESRAAGADGEIYRRQRIASEEDSCHTQISWLWRQNTGRQWKSLSQPGSASSWVKARTLLTVQDRHPEEPNRKPAQLKTSACLLAPNPGLLVRL